MARIDEFSGLDQVTHRTGAVIEGAGPGLARQHVAPSLQTARARHNSLDFQSNSTHRAGTPPMRPGTPTSATPFPPAYVTPPGYGLTPSQPTGIIAQANAHATAANQYATNAAQLRAMGRHRDAAAATSQADAHAQAARDLASSASQYTAGMPAAMKGQVMNQPTLANTDPNKYFEQPLGFVLKTVLTTAVGTAISKPQDVFRPTRLSVPSGIVAFFTIQNIRIGTNSQLVGTTEMPAQVFSELAVGSAFLLGTANVGIDISIDFTNTDTATHDFRAVMFGQTFK